MSNYDQPLSGDFDFRGRSFLDTQKLNSLQILNFLKRAQKFQARSELASTSGTSNSNKKMPVIACLFFEPSTRTRMSFQLAAYRLGCQVLTMELASGPSGGSSLSKGETLTDTVLNISSMRPDLIVIRYGQSQELDALIENFDQVHGIPVVNGGSGTLAHPSQGLLDALTLWEHWGSFDNKKLLIFGDVRHSRVARSNFDILSKLGVSLGACGPEALMPTPEQMPGIKVFANLDDGLEWADAVMGLRIQLERHSNHAVSLNTSQYHATYGLTETRLKKLKATTAILHPGPINYGAEFCQNVVNDPRSLVLKQVENGVRVRAALLAAILGLEEAI